MTRVARVRDRIRDDEGAATVEYALVTIGAAAFAAVLIAVIRSDQVRGAIADIIADALGSV